MNDVGKILIGVLIGLIFVGLAIAFAPPEAYDNSTDDVSIVDQAQSNDNVGSLSIVKNSTSSSTTVKNNSTGSQVSSSSSESGVSGGSTEYNAQDGGGYFYQINYKITQK